MVHMTDARLFHLSISQSWAIRNRGKDEDEEEEEEKGKNALLRFMPIPPSLHGNTRLMLRCTTPRGYEPAT